MPAPRKPTELLLLTGGLKRNPGRYASRLNEPKPSGPLGDVPHWLDEVQARAWRDLEAEAPPGVLTNADRGVLALAAVLRASVITRTATARDQGLLLRVYGELGMTPASRSRVSAVPRDESAEDNPFAAV